MRAILNISPKIYYNYRNKEDLDYYDYLVIKTIFDNSKGTYGYYKITLKLRNQGYNVNHKKVYRIMVILELKLLKKQKKIFIL